MAPQPAPAPVVSPAKEICGPMAPPAQPAHVDLPFQGNSRPMSTCTCPHRIAFPSALSTNGNSCFICGYRTTFPKGFWSYGTSGSICSHRQFSQRTLSANGISCCICSFRENSSTDISANGASSLIFSRRINSARSMAPHDPPPARIEPLFQQIPHPLQSPLDQSIPSIPQSVTLSHTMKQGVTFSHSDLPEKQTLDEIPDQETRKISQPHQTGSARSTRSPSKSQLAGGSTNRKTCAIVIFYVFKFGFVFFVSSVV